VLTGRLILTGDCDDYAVEKFRRVIAAGWGRAARLVIAYAGEPHMVLAIEAHHRWLVLDNRHPGLWDAAAPRFGGYVWKCRSVPGRLRWERLEGRAATLEDALRRAT
ncbi:MAG TPA: transglutaminase-like cysteine peptidase, partial [Thermohalobaculum sp.]|nr:transglutaminase-like cysteine peptidase [Thermohalobaculum sp.]